MAEPDGEHVQGSGRKIFALEVPCGVAETSFKSEYYAFAQKPAGQSLFLVLRWLIDFLGANHTRNFIGSSAPVWRNRIAEGLEVLSQDGHFAEDHLLDSSWSTLKQRAPAKRKAEEAQAAEEPDEDEPLPQQDFSISIFGLLWLLVGWAAKGPRATAKWKLESADLQRRCRALISGLVSLFVQQEPRRPSKTCGGFDFLVSRNRDGEAVLHVANLVASEKGSSLKKSFPEPSTVSLLTVLMRLVEDAGNKNFGKRRKDNAFSCCAELCFWMAEIAEASYARGDCVWARTQLHQLDQLRTRAHEKKAERCFTKRRFFLGCIFDSLAGRLGATEGSLMASSRRSLKLPVSRICVASGLFWQGKLCSQALRLCRPRMFARAPRTLRQSWKQSGTAIYLLANPASKTRRLFQ